MIASCIPEVIVATLVNGHNFKFNELVVISIVTSKEHFSMHPRRAAKRFSKITTGSAM